MGRVLAARRIPERSRACAAPRPRRPRRVGFPPAVRESVPVNALVDGPFLVQDVRGYPAVKVKVRDAAGVALVRAVRDAVGAGVGRAGRRQRRVGRRHRGAR